MFLEKILEQFGMDLILWAYIGMDLQSETHS
jgi:hypothetical protein